MRYVSSGWKLFAIQLYLTKIRKSTECFFNTCQLIGYKSGSSRRTYTICIDVQVAACYTHYCTRLNALIKTLDQYLEVLEMQLGLYSTSWKQHLEGLHALHTQLERTGLCSGHIFGNTPYISCCYNIISM